MRCLKFALLTIAVAGLAPRSLRAQIAAKDACPRPAPGAIVAEPADLRSVHGELNVHFSFRSEVDASGATRYCYVAQNGEESPTLRAHPGDTLVISLKNEMAAEEKKSNASAKGTGATMPSMTHHEAPGSCAGGGVMAAYATNLHFHGLAIPPKCHQDEVLGGASGALIIEGIERANPALADLPERVIVIRDQDLLNPNAAPPQTGEAAPAITLDPDGDARNPGSGSGKPAKDLSVNFVPVPYPNYEHAVIQGKAGEKQLWRILNASAITYLNLQMLWNGLPQDFGVVALDGVPINANGQGRGIVYENHAGVPPGGRAEFVVTLPAEGVKAELLTRSVNTGAGGENDPVRPLASIVGSKNAPALQSKLAAAPEPLPKSNLPWLGSVQPAHERRLYFTEKLEDPNDPNSPTTFYITVEGQQPVAFDPDRK